MPKASPKRPSRSANRRIQPIAIGTKNAAGSSQRVTTAPVRRSRACRAATASAAPTASANAASSAATAPGADRPSSGAPMSKRSTRRLAPSSAKNATAPISAAAMPFADTPKTLKSRAQRRDQREREHHDAGRRRHRGEAEAHAERLAAQRLDEAEHADRARRRPPPRYTQRCRLRSRSRGVEARGEQQEGERRARRHRREIRAEVAQPRHVDRPAPQRHRGERPRRARRPAARRDRVAEERGSVARGALPART